jgi:hypothetical protein
VYEFATTKQAIIIIHHHKERLEKLAYTIYYRLSRESPVAVLTHTHTTEEVLVFGSSLTNSLLALPIHF